MDNGRDSEIEDAYCIAATSRYGCTVGANITTGTNTGFTGPPCWCMTSRCGRTTRTRRGPTLRWIR